VVRSVVADSGPDVTDLHVDAELRSIDIAFLDATKHVMAVQVIATLFLIVCSSKFLVEKR